MTFPYAPLSWDAPLDAYDAQAAQLREGHAAGDEDALALLHRTLPRFLDEKVTWLPRPLTMGDIRATALDHGDARLAVARTYSFRDWEALTALVVGVADTASPVHAFERAVEAVITGDTESLGNLLSARPDLVVQRSNRVTCHDPAVHGATLLHYLAANGVEGFRQQSPPNAVAIARLLLEHGAQADALAGAYGGESPTLSLLVSSTPPATAGVQVPLVHALLDHGANPNGAGSGAWRSPLLTALVFGFREAAEALVERGARVDDVVKAAGLGRVDDVRSMLTEAAPDARHRAFALASLGAQLDVVRLLLAAGEEPGRLNPEGFHSHGTPLHHAAAGGNLDLVKLLIAHGANADVRDTLWNGTPLGWAEHAGREEVVRYLRGVTLGAA